MGHGIKICAKLLLSSIYSGYHVRETAQYHSTLYQSFCLLHNLRLFILGIDNIILEFFLFDITLKGDLFFLLCHSGWKNTPVKKGLLL